MDPGWGDEEPTSPTMCRPGFWLGGDGLGGDMISSIVSTFDGDEARAAKQPTDDVQFTYYLPTVPGCTCVLVALIVRTYDSTLK